jgi:hypothetical protein
VPGISSTIDATGASNILFTIRVLFLADHVLTTGRRTATLITVFVIVDEGTSTDVIPCRFNLIESAM